MSGRRSLHVSLAHDLERWLAWRDEESPAKG